MSEAKFTKGPWAVERDRDHWEIAAGSEILAMVYPVMDPPDREDPPWAECESTARLMGEALEMYKLLEALRNEMAAGRIVEPQTMPQVEVPLAEAPLVRKWLEQCIQRIDKQLAKARGETP